MENVNYTYQEKENNMEKETQTPHKRRVRYKGKYPRKFEEKYKEYTGWHAYFNHGQ